MKMCGNCGKTDHKYVDCPYIDMQFPLTKKEHAELQEKARKYDEVKGGTLGFIRAFNWLDQNKSIFEKERKLRERIERTKMHTETVLSDDSPNKEELQRVINLLDYLLQDEK